MAPESPTAHLSIAARVRQWWRSLFGGYPGNRPHAALPPAPPPPQRKQESDTTP